MSETPTLRLRLHGSFDAAWSDGAPLQIKGAKLQALVALLATAAEGKRTRVWLRDMLWSRSGPEHGRANLRQTLSALRVAFGERFDVLFEVDNDAIRLRLDRVVVTGGSADGVFLEGLDLRGEGFDAWARERRARGSAAVPVVAAVTRIAPERSPLPVVAVVPPVSIGEGTAPLADALAQEITRALSRSSLLSVISHLSCRRLDARTLALDAMTEALGADYLVWGNLRLDGALMRLDLDFIETRGGRVLWTRRLEGRLADFTQGEAGIVETAAAEIGRTVLTAAVDLAAARPLPEVETHALLMSGVSMMHHQSLASFGKARVHLEEVARRAPGYSYVQAWLAMWYVLSVQQGWSVDRAGDMAIALDHTARALDLNPQCAFSLAIDGFARNHLVSQLDQAARSFEEAIAVDPNNALAWLMKGMRHAFTGDGATAVACTTRARGLSPLDPQLYFFDALSASAHFVDSDYTTALAFAERSLAANRRHASSHRVRTAALEMLGRHEEARASARTLIRLEPNLTVEGYLRAHPAAAFEAGRRFVEALGRAGLPMR